MNKKIEEIKLNHNTEIKKFKRPPMRYFIDKENGMVGMYIEFFFQYTIVLIIISLFIGWLI